MKLHRARDLPSPPSGRVFRQSSWPGLFLAGFFGVLTAGLATATVALGLPWILWGLVAAFGLLEWLVLPAALAALRPTSWLAALEGERLWIQFRSYGNQHLDADVPTVVELGLDELASVRRRERRFDVPSGDGTQSWQEKSLELLVAAAGATDDLAAAIAAERVREAPLAGFVRSRMLHFPVSVPEPGVIRVTWRGRQDFVRPSLDSFLAALEGRVRVEEEVSDEALAGTHWHRVSEEEVNAMIVELARAGETLQAIKLLRGRFGYSLGEAKTILDNLLREAA